MTPGAQLRCVDDTPPSDYRNAPRLHVGATYTLLREEHGVWGAGVIVEEARFPRVPGQVEHGWFAHRFVEMGGEG